MYKGLIVAVTLLLIGGAGYYFKQAGVPDLVTQNIKQGKDSKSYGVSAMEVFSGLYECTESNGCKNNTKLILEDDTTLDITATIDGQDISLGQGTWGIGKDGSLILVLQTTDSSAGPPRSIIAKKISTLRISGFSNKKALFPGMENPTFNRIKEVEKDAVQGGSQPVEQGGGQPDGAEPSLQPATE